MRFAKTLDLIDAICYNKNVRPGGELNPDVDFSGVSVCPLTYRAGAKFCGIASSTGGAALPYLGVIYSMWMVFVKY